MIRDALKVFADGSTQMGKATQGLLEELNLNFQYEQTEEAMDFATMYCGVTGQHVPQNLKVVLDSVEATYLVGFMTHKSLQELNKELDDSTQLVGDFLCFAVDVESGITLSRSKAATLVRGFNRIAAANPVLLIIRQGNTISLALCERTEYTQQWRQGKKLGKVRILMGINCMNPHRGHVDMLERLAKHSYTDHEQVYAHWLEVFSVSNLTDLFYTELQNWYFWAVRVAKFPNDTSRTDDYQKYNDEALIRLITRLIFVWFLKEKGLINADLFDEGKLMGILKDFNPQAADNGAYYNAILQNLFFATLNQEIGNRRFVNDNYKLSIDQHNIKTYYRGKELFNTDNEDDIKALFASTPYVNGSLFECLDDRTVDGVTYHYDGFSNKTAFKNGTMRRALIPNRLFFAPEGSERLDMKEEYGKEGTYMVTVSGLINILNRYHFTIEENTPSEEQIALDPELLGRTFENLLGAFNPETKQSARKATGSYYTPREIVDYMVEQSLKAYFTTKCPQVAENDIASLLDDSETMKPDNISDKDTEALLQAIYSCNILDPACGSGAFPMGILQRLVIALRKLDADNSHWGEIIKGRAMKEIDSALEEEKEDRRQRLEAIEESFTRQKEHPDFARKLYVIESCIHGVDIQPIAIQISKLRFFISLLCDQKTNNNPDDNYGILTLPNLETNLVAANSLVALKKGEQRSLFENPDIEPTKAELTEVRHQLFSARTVTAKRKLRKRDKELRTTLAALLQADGFFAPEDALQLAAWDPYDQNASSPFFDPEWMFGIKDGFDIVIGNPPYVQLQNDRELGDLYEACGYKTFARMGDMYCLFYERGWQLLKSGGNLCYITSNKWMRAGYGEKTRGFFANYTNPILLIDFAGVKIFENATVDTNIMLFSRSENRHETTCFVATKENKDSVKKNLNSFVQQQHTIHGFNSSDSWVILSPIEQSIKQKIEAVGTPLKDWDIQINYGIKTGCNDAFIINTEKRNEILANCLTEEERKRTEELIRPILRGKDIKRYGYDWAGKWLIWIPWHFPLHLDDTIRGASQKAEQEFQRLYPSVYNHLLQFKTQLSKRNKAETGIRYEWYALQRWGAKYWEDFDKPKVIYMEIQTDNPNEGYPFPCFSYDDTNAVVLNTAYIMCSHTVDVRYILGILNSKLGKFLVKMYVTQLQERQFRMLAQYTNRFPIPKISAEQMGKITELVELEINSHNDDIETDIDNIVFNIFGLNENEIKHVKDREV